jgi:ATP/maltotriose-dependent transcriptional regulator MalT
MAGADVGAADQPTTTSTAAAPASSDAIVAAGGTSAELSQRERAVLLKLAQGLSNKEIARVLSVSENTIKTHVANIYAKLGVNRRTEALKAAQQLGLA